MKRPIDTGPAARMRTRYHINGIVQGVGFRPFIYRLATGLDLGGFVKNDPHGVTVEVEGDAEHIRQFARRVQAELPLIASITEMSSETLAPQYLPGFRIIASDRDEAAATLISPDIATCPDCLRELFDPADRRYRYPFINCTNCGPRYTIVKAIPYDRPLTSMAAFQMCPECQREYDDPGNRRFHAQPNACPVCGPTVVLRDTMGKELAGDPIAEAVALLKQGKILAIRGVGGFHLAVDATSDPAVRELRRRKGRAEKPLALMAQHVRTVEKFCVVTHEEHALLEDYRRPIVLLRKNGEERLAESIAPGQRYLGFMLPYTPLHHLLLRGNFDALVMTSGNYTDEPIAIANEEALERLSALADCFVLHDRDILQRCDDSIVRMQSGVKRIIRRSRGYVPMPISIKTAVTRPLVAVGGELKNTVALARGKDVFLSQHIGDLDNPSALGFFEESIAHLQKIFEVRPEVVVHDLHPDYLSTQWAMRQNLPRISVQHHHAHLASVLADSGYAGKAIGLILDGTGYGTDGTIWGGEVLVGDAMDYGRFAWLQPVVMPGGAMAIRYPWRMAASYLRAAYGDKFIELGLPALQVQSKSDLKLLSGIIKNQVNSPVTSSCGRLFDAVAALLGFDGEAAYEAQAAIELEMLVGPGGTFDYTGYAEAIKDVGTYGPLQTAPLIRAIVDDLRAGKCRDVIAGDFHSAIVQVFVNTAKAARDKYGIDAVALSGGVYQNVIILDTMVRRLEREGFLVLTHSRVPANDGGLALGQVAVAVASMTNAVQGEG